MDTNRETRPATACELVDGFERRILLKTATSGMHPQMLLLETQLAGQILINSHRCRCLWSRPWRTPCFSRKNHLFHRYLINYKCCKPLHAIVVLLRYVIFYQIRFCPQCDCDTTSYVGAQELTRALTCSDTPVNSAVGGAAAGALAFMSHGGNPVLGAGIVAAMGCSIDMLSRLIATSGSRGNEPDTTASLSSIDRLFRKTTDEEREAFLEKRRRRILRIDVESSSSTGKKSHESSD